MLVLPGTLDDKEAEARSQEIVKLVEEVGKDVEVMPMGKNRLAYPIKQIRYGYFFTYVFMAEPEKVKSLEDKLVIMRDVLRIMISHFNTTLTASQKIAYTTDAAGITTMMEREESAAPAQTVAPAAPAAAKVEELVEETGDAKPESKVARKIDKLDMEDINKKLDEIMEGDVIPGV